MLGFYCVCVHQRADHLSATVCRCWWAQPPWPASNAPSLSHRHPSSPPPPPTTLPALPSLFIALPFPHPSPPFPSLSIRCPWCSNWCCTRGVHRHLDRLLPGPCRRCCCFRWHGSHPHHAPGCTWRGLLPVGRGPSCGLLPQCALGPAGCCHPGRILPPACCRPHCVCSSGAHPVGPARIPHPLVHRVLHHGGLQVAGGCNRGRGCVGRPQLCWGHRGSGSG